MNISFPKMFPGVKMLPGIKMFPGVKMLPGVKMFPGVKMAARRENTLAKAWDHVTKFSRDLKTLMLYK